MVEYIVAKDFKLGLYHHIRYILRLVERDAIYHAETEQNILILTYTEMPDWLFLKKINIDFNKWQSYLFYMIKEGYTSIQRSELTKIHRRNLYKEEQKIWQSLKQTQ